MPDSSARDRAARVIARYDWEHGVSANPEPGVHTYGEVDALLANPEVLRALAGVASGRCGATPEVRVPRIVDRAACSLSAGHSGWHRDDDLGTEWGRTWVDPEGATS